MSSQPSTIAAPPPMSVLDALEALDEGFSLWDADDRLVLCNARYRELYPLSAHLMVPGAAFADLVRYAAENGEVDIPVAEREQWIRTRIRLHREPREEAFEQRLADGRWLLVSEYRTRAGGVAGIRVDITARKRMEIALARLSAIGSRPGLTLEDRMRELLELGCEHFDLPIGAVSSFDGEHFTVRHAASRDIAQMLVPGTRYRAAGSPCERAVTTGERIAWTDGMAGGVAGGAAPLARLLPQSALGACLGAAFSVDGRPAGTVCFFGPARARPFSSSDFELLRLLAQWVGHEAERHEAMDARDRARAELERLATIDDLTGLLNRRALLAFGRTEFARARRFGHPLCVLALDLDFFKQINDTLGHAGGDRVLHEVATCCRNGVRNIDGVGRLGGEEFVLVLVQTGQGPGMEVGERIRAAVGRLECGDDVRVTASIGVAGMGEADDDFDALLARADAALYWAKERGRNRVCLAPG